MNIEDVKQKMKEYRDLFGNEFLDHADIDGCESIYDFDRIIERHREHLNSMISDAEADLDIFKKRLDIF